MKIFILAALVCLLTVSAFANATTPVLIVKNVGASAITTNGAMNCTVYGSGGQWVSASVVVPIGLAPGQTVANYHDNGTGAPYTYFTFDASNVGYGTYNIVALQPLTFDQNGSPVCEIDISNIGADSCTTNATFTWLNDFTQNWNVWILDSRHPGVQISASTVPPGGSYNQVITVSPCSDVQYLSLQIAVATNWTTLATNSPTLYPSSSDLSTNLNLWNNTNLNNAAVSDPPLWTNITQDINGINATAQQGAQGIINAVNTASQQAKNDSQSLLNGVNGQLSANSQQATKDANAIVAAVDKVRNQAHTDAGVYATQEHSDLQAIQGAVMAISNSPPFIPTNYATESTQAGISNLLSQLVSNTIPSTNTGFSYSNSMAAYASAGSDVNAATTAATGIIKSATDAFQAVIDGIDPSPELAGDPGSSDSWIIHNFCGRDINLDPVVYVPAAFSFSLAAWSFILAALYLNSVANMYIKVIRGFAAMQTGGVPDLEITALGFGGNLVGAGIAVIVPPLLVGMWILLVSFTIGDLSSVLASTTGITTAVSSLVGTPQGAMAWHVIVNAFPVSLAVHLLLARIVLQFTLAKSFFIAAAISRFLFGK